MEVRQLPFRIERSFRAPAVAPPPVEGSRARQRCSADVKRGEGEVGRVEARREIICCVHGRRQKSLAVGEWWRVRSLMVWAEPAWPPLAGLAE